MTSDSASSSEAIDHRGYILIGTGIVALVLGLPAYYEFVTSVEMMGGFPVEEVGPQLEWWVQPAMVIAALAALYGFATALGWIHRPPKTADEIMEEHSNDR